MTHSFKVARVASRLAERLMSEEANVELVPRLDVDAVQAAGLGDDLGHSPFGHLAEEILADVMQGAGGPETAVAMRAGARGGTRRVGCDIASRVWEGYRALAMSRIADGEQRVRQLAEAIVAIGSEISLNEVLQEFGLVGMRERTTSVSGELVIESKPGAGTRLTVKIPVHEATARLGASSR